MSGPTDSLLTALRDPAFYPHRPAEVNVVETHISWVFLAGDLVYKCKKPVRFDFLDFSTLESRRRACDDEVRLNRRLASEIYLGVVPVTQVGESWKLKGEGPAVEWLVEMRRLPTQESLDHKLWRGELRETDLIKLADLLLRFFRDQQPAAVLNSEYRDRLITRVQQNRAELLATAHHLPADAVKRIHAAQLRLLQLQPEIFDQRVQAGKVVEGHGDLRPEHICLTDQPVIFDCVEFNAELRTLDIADDLAFLAMECDSMGAPWVGAKLFEALHQVVGDPTPALLTNFYKSYRACVRAKVAALRAEQLQGISREAAICQARNYLLLADSYLKEAEQPLLLVIGGLSGTGKSTLARSLSESLGADVLRTDAVRRQLFPDSARAPIDSGSYSPALREQVYATLLEQAESAVRSGNSVILDATFAGDQQIQAAHSVAQRTAAPFLAIECECPPDVAVRRIRERAAAQSDLSQADEVVYWNQQKLRQPWPAEIPLARLDTTRPVPELVQQVVTALTRSQRGAVSLA